jgi:hypothetical protein
MTVEPESARRTPADVAAAMERAESTVPPKGGDVGYAVWGLSFESGHLLALRRYPPRGTVPGYTCVWHRDPDGVWTFYADVGAGRGCHRYFGLAVERLVVAPIRVEWTDPLRLLVTIDGGCTLSWSIELASSLGTRLTTACLRAVPNRAWRHEGTVRALARVIAWPLRSGRLHLTGLVPTGAHFTLRPLALWRIVASRAKLHGHDLGQLTRPTQQAALGDYVIPRSGLFVVGESHMRA